jgi:hypothetical protein
MGFGEGTGAEQDNGNKSRSDQGIILKAVKDTKAMESIPSSSEPHGHSGSKPAESFGCKTKTVSVA